MSGTGAGQAVTGFIASATNTFDPVTDGYPASNPPTGPLWSVKNEGFAGIIHGTPVGGGATLLLYCIDINTSTYAGIGYALGSWDASNVQNVGFVARLLNEYYPSTNLPVLANLNQTAAAVQAAIWFFSDRYVLSTSDPLRAAVVAIVDHIIAEGPLTEPPPPSLAITPAHVSGARHVHGPFTVTTDAADGAVVTATGGSMFSDRAGTTPIADGATVPSGQRIWLRSTGPETVVLQATSEATVPSGNVYLYDGNTSGVADAQRLILAQQATLKTTVQATADFQPGGSLVVQKRITGPAAGSQGRVVIRVTCDDGVSRRPLVIAAGAHAGVRSRTYRHIVAGTLCTVTETSDGGTTTVEVIVRGDGQQVTIPAGGEETVNLTDVYRFVPGSLLVRKTIAGPAAGQQGEVRIHTVCNGRALKPDFVIPAGAAAGDHTHQYDGIRVPATCTVKETADGHTSSVSVVVEGSGQTVHVQAGRIVEADLADTYGLRPGQLEVTKSITGAFAGLQGPVVIHTVCNGIPVAPDFIIPAGTPAGLQSQIYSGIPTPASCVVTETANGGTAAVSAVVIGSPHTVSIPAGGAGAAHITDVFGGAAGSLLINKTIAGELAGRQGPITIHVACDGLSRDIVIDAGTRAGRVSRSVDGIPAGSVCTVSELASGASATVSATVSGNLQTVTVPAGRVVAVSLTDVYEGRAGVLGVRKTVAGSAARRHRRIAILVDCGGPLDNFTFRLRAHVRGSTLRYFDGLPAGARCAVIEATDGHTGAVAVVASRRRRMTIRPHRTVTAHVTDRFEPRAPRPVVTG